MAKPWLRRMAAKAAGVGNCSTEAGRYEYAWSCLDIMEVLDSPHVARRANRMG